MSKLDHSHYKDIFEDDLEIIENSGKSTELFSKSLNLRPDSQAKIVTNNQNACEATDMEGLFGNVSPSIFLQIEKTINIGGHVFQIMANTYIDKAKMAKKQILLTNREK